MTQNCPTKVYYWPRNFVMRTCHFEQALRDKPYRRLSATLIANGQEPFILQAGAQPALETHIALLSPQSLRRQLRINGGDCFLFDVDITSNHFAGLKPLLPHTGSREPTEETVKAIFEKLQPLRGHAIDACQAVELFNEVMALMADKNQPPRQRDQRIQEVLELIESSYREDISVAGLARAVGLSESRLRSLVQKEIGCSLSRYLRWATAWKTADIWHPDMTLTEAAHAAGFHDLSHANRTFVELFGLAPSRLLKSGQVELERCEKAAAA